MKIGSVAWGWTPTPEDMPENDSLERIADNVRALGFDDRFVRIWDFYLAYCEAAFARENTDVVQYTLRVR